MKKIIFLLISVTSLYACKQESKKQEIQRFITGTYVTTYDNEFHRTWDTLIIKQNIAGNQVYDILNAVYYTTTVDGKTLSPVHKKSSAVGLYDDKMNILYEQKHGAIISFDPASNTLQRGAIKYMKIK